MKATISRAARAAVSCTENRRCNANRFAYAPISSLSRHNETEILGKRTRRSPAQSERVAGHCASAAFGRERTSNASVSVYHRSRKTTEARHDRAGLTTTQGTLFMTHKQMSSKGGKAGKGSEAKRAAAIKANAARWKNHRKPKLWCAWCGVWGDHQSGWCPDLKKAIAKRVARRSNGRLQPPREEGA